MISGMIATAVALPISSTISNAGAVEYRTITANSVNFRTGPGTNYSSMGKLNKGYKVEYIGTSGSWTKIKYNGKTGYAYSDYVSTSSTSNNVTIKVVTATTLNVRSGAGTNYSKIGTLSKGSEVSVISESNGWAKIDYNGRDAYVSSNYLSSKSESNTGDESIKSYKIVTATSLNFRSGPGTSYSKISSISYGTEVGVISESNGWSKIKYNNKIGYVSSNYLTTKSSGSIDSSTSSTKVSKVISYAKSLLGKKYSWGAEGPNTFDCSGFTYYVLKQSAGITIPRVSKDQSKYGTYVNRNDVKEGDLVFFDTNGSNDGNVSHVGIYIGNGQFIHASSSKGEVVISDFNSNYYKGAYVNARRVL